VSYRSRRDADSGRGDQEKEKKRGRGAYTTAVCPFGKVEDLKAIDLLKLMCQVTNEVLRIGNLAGYAGN
jgi:hypothetical protein